MRHRLGIPTRALAICALVSACGDSDEVEPDERAKCTVTLAPGDDDQSTVQGALIDAKEGDVICFKAGRYEFENQLTLSENRVTVRGTADTVFDFSKQTSGANGIELTGDGDTVESLKILDTKGDGVRATEVVGVTFRKIHVEWTRGPHTDNGGYGIYPVSSRNILIEDCFASGASDTGIYVGQSEDIIIRRNEATLNVAGIEIENSSDAEAYDNHCHDNTAGLLVFNLPGLRRGNGKRSNVHHNRLEQNNHENFATKGNILADAPPGTGLFILAADDNQVHHNKVKDNHSSGIGIWSWYIALRDEEGRADRTYDFFPEGNYVFDNEMSNNGREPQARAVLIGASAGESTIADIAWDGIIDWEKVYKDEDVPEQPDASKIPAGLRNCFKPGDASFMNMDLEHDGANRTTSTGAFDCEHDLLPSIQL